MIASRLMWAGGGYLAGTLPSTWIVARSKGAHGLLAAAGRSSGETDPHILMTSHLGVGWTALAATMDVLKGLVFVLAAREWGHLNPAWLALCGVTVVVGHAFPFYLKDMAGRGLAAASGVLLVLLPAEMVVAGLIIVAGGAARVTGLASTVAMASVPLVAVVQGQPGEFVAMGAAILAIIVIRRIEGIGEVTERGITPGRALLYRCLYDASEPPARLNPWGSREGNLPQ
ncbi:MAG TPA: glycerol-3-phosphate acyltransferase [Actinomycetota bacterium]